MATTIKLKNGSGAPAASDLVQGEPAIDLTNKRLYTEDSSGTVIEVGSNPSSLSINGTAVTATAAEINTLDGITSSTAELNILDGVTSTAAELNILDGVTATTAEINILDGVTSTTAELNILDGVTSTAAELNILDGVTATTAELNILDGVTSTTAELNILDGVTSTAAELNILDGVTSTTAELNILDGVTATAAELNVLDGVTAFVDEDDMSSDSATSIPSQQSVKAYVDSQVASADTLAELTDTNITSPADAALLFYDTGTSKWIDNVVSGDITIADTGVAAIGSGVIVNADVNASAAIDVSKTALTAGTGLTLSTNTLSVDASQTQITAVGTIGTGTWQGTAIADAYVANDLTISGGTVNNTVIGGSTPAAGTFSALVASSLTYPTSDGTNGQALITNGSGTLSFGDVSGGGGITYVTKTANYTMSAGEGVIANTSGGTFTITLPASPSTGDQVIIADGSNWATTNLTVGRNGSTIEGVASDLTCDVEGISVTMVYDGSTWQLYPQTGTSPSLGIDDNATSTAVTIDSNGDVSIGTATAGVSGLSISSNKNLGWTQSSGESLANMFRQQSSGALVIGQGYQRSATSNGFASSYSSSLSRTAAWFGDSIRFYTDAASTVAAGTDITPTERVRIDNSGNVGIGTTSPSYKLDVDVGAPGSQDQLLGRFSSQAGTRSIAFVWDDSASTLGIGTQTNHPLAFHINGSSAEKMRITTNGTALIGKTSEDNSTVGCRLNASGDVSFVADGARALVVVRKTSDGQLALFLKDSTYIGQVNARSAQLSIGNLGTGLEFNDSNDAIIPFNLTGNNTRDNALDLGMSSVRFDDVYATNGTIQTSDRNEKQDIETLSEAEQRVAVAAKALLRKFRWKSAVRTKSHDARIHFGIIAQDLQAAFEAEGLDASDYGLFICSEWWETYTDVPAVQAVEAQDAVYDEEGNLVSEAVEAVEAVEAHTRTDTYNTEAEAPEDAVRKERMGVRYSELLAFIIAAI